MQKAELFFTIKLNIKGIGYLLFFYIKIDSITRI